LIALIGLAKIFGAGAGLQECELLAERLRLLCGGVSMGGDAVKLLTRYHVVFGERLHA
jgi:hypothetical protein